MFKIASYLKKTQIAGHSSCVPRRCAYFCISGLQRNGEKNQYSIVKIDTFDELDNRNITIKHAIQILNQQWRLNGLRPRTIDSYNYNFKRFVEVTKVEYLHEINNEKIYQYLSSFKNAKDTSLHGL